MCGVFRASSVSFVRFINIISVREGASRLIPSETNRVFGDPPTSKKSVEIGSSASLLQQTEYGD